jgi:hypothetical protein
MSSSMFQQAFHGGDKRRVSRLASAVQSAPHWNASAKPAYLQPNSGSLQKPIEGLPEKIEDRSAIGAFSNQNHVKKRRGIGTRENDRNLSEVYLKGGYKLHRAQQFPIPLQIKSSLPSNTYTSLLFSDSHCSALQ